MQIKFNNGKTFTYTQAFGLERDFKDGYTRPSIEILMPVAQTSYNEIESIITDLEIMKSFTLIGDSTPIPVYKEETVVNGIINVDGTPILDANGNQATSTTTQVVKDENGEPVVDHYDYTDPVVNTYEDYTIKGKISVEDGNITFKVYRLSDTEIERNEAIQAVDELLLAMEG